MIICDRLGNDMFLIAAHRGGNSIDSIVDSIEKKYDYVELDVHLSYDKELIVQYSPLVCINNSIKYIEDIRYHKLSKTDRERLLLLEDVFKITKGKIGIIIDIKHGISFYPHIGKYVAEKIKEYDLCKETWIISFDHMCLDEAKNHIPSVKISPMYVARIFEEYKYWERIRADGIEICNEYLDQESIRVAHRMGLTMIGWCSQDREELLNLVKMGIDIITIEKDDPILDLLQTIQSDA